MLPTEPPLSLHRLVAPVPPARMPEVAVSAHQAKPDAVTAAPVSNAMMAQAAHHPVPVLLAAHDQTGNAAVVKAALRAVPATASPLMIASPKSKSGAHSF